MKNKEDLTIEEYHTMIRHKSGGSKGQKYKITNSYNCSDYLKYYNSIKPKDKKYILGKSNFNKIMFLVGEKMMDEYVKTRSLRFPYHMGSLVLNEIDIKPRIVDGKLTSLGAINWDETIKLWYEDEEAEREKILVRHNNKKLYRTNYSRSTAKYKNQMYYNFSIIRDVKKRLSAMAKENNLVGFKRY